MSDLIAQLLAVVGPKGLVTDPADMAPYLTDWRFAKKGEALCVVEPASTEEVSAVVRLASEAGRPIVPIAGNTGMVYGAIPLCGSGDEAAIMLSLRRMNRIRETDLASGIVWVDAGVILATLHEAADAVGRQFPLRLGSEGSAQIGGLVSTNAGGTAALRYGSMRELVAGLEVVMPDGRIFSDMTALAKNNTGYMLRQLFIGAEGSLGVVAGAALKLHPKMTSHAHAWIAVETPERVIELFELFQNLAGQYIEAFELLSGTQVELVKRHVAHARIAFDTVPAWSVMVELSAADATADLEALLQSVLEQAFEDGLIEDAVLATSNQQAEEIWRVRHSLGEANMAAGVVYPLDIAVRPSTIPQFIREAGAVCAEAFPEATVLVIGHVGDGNLHYVLLFPKDYWNAHPDTTALGHRIEQVVHDVVVRLGGTFSAEHGIGRKLPGELARLTDPLNYELMGRIKALLDPQGIMNPGVLFPEAS